MIFLLTLLRSAFGIVFGVAITFLCSVLVMLAAFAGRSKLATLLIRDWAVALTSVFGIRIAIRGDKHLPDAGGGIIVFNHQSHFDIPAIMVTTTKNIRFGAKIELFKIPFFGAAMRAIGTLPIARENRSEVLKIYRDAEKRFQENTIFVLAPEGTRQKEPVVGRFKKGPFLFAINAQVPVIPVVIKGAHAVMPKNSIGVNLGAKSRTIELEYLAPVSTIGLTVADAGALMDRVREAMVKAYERES